MQNRGEYQEYTEIVKSINEAGQPLLTSFSAEVTEETFGDI